MTQILVEREVLGQVLAALQSVDDLIKHQYTGTKEGMNALQYAANDCLLAQAVLMPLLDQPSGPKQEEFTCTNCGSRIRSVVDVTRCYQCNQNETP